MKRICCLIVLASSAGLSFAKLPALSDEAKAKAAEASAKTAWGDKVAGFQLCKAMDHVATVYLADAKKAGKDIKPVATPACADPGAFVYPPPDLAAAAKTPAAAQGPAKKP
jgi:hypothetical protein